MIEDRYRSLIQGPIITEKSSTQREDFNQFTFRVARQTNKIEIKKAIEKLFKVKVEGVRIMNYRGKVKRVGRSEGKRANWKKAIVTLREGDHIDFFEGG